MYATLQGTIYKSSHQVKRIRYAKIYMRAIIAKLSLVLCSILKSSYLFHSYLYAEAVLPYSFRTEASFHTTTGLLMKRRKRRLRAGNISCLCPNNPGIYLHHCTGQQLLNSTVVFQIFQDSFCCFPQVPFLLTATVMHLYVLQCSFSTSSTSTCMPQELSC